MTLPPNILRCTGIVAENVGPADMNIPCAHRQACLRFLHRDGGTEYLMPRVEGSSCFDFLTEYAYKMMGERP
jgi:hypothetical protein